MMSLRTDITNMVISGTSSSPVLILRSLVCDYHLVRKLQGRGEQLKCFCQTVDELMGGFTETQRKEYFEL